MLKIRKVQASYHVSQGEEESWKKHVNKSPMRLQIRRKIY